MVYIPGASGMVWYDVVCVWDGGMVGYGVLCVCVA